MARARWLRRTSAGVRVRFCFGAVDRVSGCWLNEERGMRHQPPSLPLSLRPSLAGLALFLTTVQAT